MLHQSGFPYAPMGPAVWGERASRRDKMASWRLNWEPGTRYEYHPTAAHWVQAELIETVTGTDFRDAVEELVDRRRSACRACSGCRSTTRTTSPTSCSSASRRRATS